MTIMERGLIVSCQALPNEPLHSSFIMGKMARAAKEGGAIGIRANSVSDIKAIQSEVNLPIIGIIKQDYEQLVPYITPTMKEVDALAQLNIEIIAMDATMSQDESLIKAALTKYPHQKFMADISTVEEGLRAEKLGFHYIGTTLVGYTEHSKQLNNFEVLAELIATCQVPIVAEGNFDTPEKARRALEMGAHCVVVGGAITRPQLITKRFNEEMLKAL